MAYCTIDELTAELGISDNSDSALLGLSIDAAERQINAYCGRRTFGVDAAVTTRRYRPTWRRRLVQVDEISSTTGMVVDVDMNDDGIFELVLTLNTDFVLLPDNATVDGVPYDEILFTGSSTFSTFSTSDRAPLRVTALFGWPAVPADVHKACLIQAAQLYKAKDTAFGVAGFGDLGVLRIQARLNPLAAALLDAYQRAVIA